MTKVDSIIHELEKTLPPIFARKEVGKLTGGLVAPHTLANADAKGAGPAGRMWIGRHTAYSREDFLAWLRVRIRQVTKKENSTHPVNEGDFK